MLLLGRLIVSMGEASRLASKRLFSCFSFLRKDFSKQVVSFQLNHINFLKIKYYTLKTKLENIYL